MGKIILYFDATSQYRSPYLLSVQDLNYWGYVLNMKNPEWIEIPIPNQNYRKRELNIDYTNKEKTIYKCNYEFDGYLALSMRELYFENDEDFFLEYLDLGVANLELDSFFRRK